MDLLQTILSCREEDITSIIDEHIMKLNKDADKVEKLGFLNYGKSNSTFKGFIPLKTRIKYANLNLEDYSMESTDFFYEFAHFIRKYNIENKTSLIHNLEFFINSYFGYPEKMDRETIFYEKAWNSTTTDEEFFKTLKNNKIGDLKGTGAAQCTERGALAQQILSLFGTECYYCMGCVDLGEKQEGHCFNIVKRKDDYAIIDYSIPVTQYNNDGSVKAFYPFVGIMTTEEFEEFMNNGIIKSFDDYEYSSDYKQISTKTHRMYVVGKYEIEKENTKNELNN